MNMGASSRCLSSLNCEVSILRAKNIELKSSGDLFVRCYLSAGNNTRVQLNSKEISSKSDLFWDEFFSLECLGTEEAINSLKQGTVVFELRWRSAKSVLGRIGGSKLLGTAEIPWKNVFESPYMEIETWVWMTSKNSHVNPDVKPPSVQVQMKVGVPPSEITNERTQNEKLRRRLDESCGCKDGGCQSVDYVDYEFFALGFALEAL